MNMKNLIVLAIITLGVVVAATMLTQEKTVSTEQGKLFPMLMQDIDDVTEINIVTKDETITVIHNGNQQWQMKEKHLYPVSLDKVHKLLLGMANLTILEAKTDNSARYAKIGVEEPTSEDAQSSLITLKKAEKILASLIVGNDRMAKIDSTRREIYVRKAGEKQAWLTLGQLSVEKQSENWLDQRIIDLAGDDIRQVEITQAGKEKTLIFKNTPDDEKFQLANLPNNTKVKLPYVLDNISTTLSRLDFDDVMSEIDFKANITAIFTSFDGLEVTMDIMEKEEKYYAKLMANFNPDRLLEEVNKDEKSETDIDEKMDAKTVAAEINTKLSGWVYELASYKVDDLLKDRAELIGTEEEIPLDEVVEENVDRLPPLIDIENPVSFDIKENTITNEQTEELPSPFSSNSMPADIEVKTAPEASQEIELKSALGTPSTTH